MSCLPFRVEVKEGVGRCVVAARDIPALDVILRDYPAMVGPYYDQHPLCLECLVKTDGTTVCPLCDLPLCAVCQGGATPTHNTECQFFSELRKTMEMPKNAPNTPYLITILRILSVRYATHYSQVDYIPLLSFASVREAIQIKKGSNCGKRP